MIRSMQSAKITTLKVKVIWIFDPFCGTNPGKSLQGSHGKYFTDTCRRNGFQCVWTASSDNRNGCYDEENGQVENGQVGWSPRD